MLFFAQLVSVGGVRIRVEGACLATRPQPAEPAEDAGTKADPDALLMARFQRGERRCFDELFQRYKRQVLNFAYRYTGRRDVAEELAQEIFVKCFQAAPTYRPEAKFSTWLFRIARNHCLNALRRRDLARPERPLHPVVAAPDATPEAQVSAQDLQRLVETTLQQLPERQRTALLLSRQQHLSYDEIAKAMKTSVSAVKSLLNRAKEMLLAKIEQGGFANELQSVP
jgi:RNA polymerase sigma-70 factor (ECF subfamily)